MAKASKKKAGRKVGTGEIKTPPPELMELSHEAVPGYRGVFYGVFSLGVIYLGLIFLI